MLKDRKLEMITKPSAVLRVKWSNGAVWMEDVKKRNPSEGSPTAIRVFDYHALFWTI